ncbi:hypothetical protein BGZ83_008169 [Gryganskiella cystojenkinii]|nr:hypothetical protein BGZ83_008169 [Gryganskiella cystojenkinii]
MYQRPAVTQRISYVLRKDENRNAHLLGVNALALDTSTLTANPPDSTEHLLDPHSHHSHAHSRRSQHHRHALPGGILYTGGRDGMIASWDLHIESPLARDIPGEDIDQPKGLPPSTFRQSFNHHTDWVNDIVLCHNGETLVSASSDRTVKLVRPHSHSPTTAHIIGTHGDYVKTLAYASGAGWVASGGLDKTVHLWDIKEGRTGQFGALGSIPETSSKASVYALACNPAGTVLATGSPEKIIRVWDPRSGQRITKFAGHTDNIRALLVSESGDTILSASSDTTVKLWSLTAQRCITTFTMHSDSVWSLYSDHPQLATFYAGGKDGLVTKTEINRYNPQNSGDYDDEDPGQCVVICKADAGVARLVAHDNARIWTATSSSSVYQWPDIPTRANRSSELAEAIVPANLLKMNLNESTFTDPMPESYYPTSTVYSAASLGSLLPGGMGGTGRDKLSQHSSEDDEGLITPIFDQPENVILGEHGLIKHTVLNNRRMVVTEDKCGEVALWDLIKCVQVDTYTGRKLDDVVNELNTIESVPTWCTIDTRIGALTVHLDEGRCFDAEVYADEVEEVPDPERPDDMRISIGKWVLKNLFERYIPVHIDAYEKEQNRQLHQDDPPTGQLSVPTTVITNERNEVVDRNDTQNTESSESTATDRPTINTSPEGLKNPSGTDNPTPSSESSKGTSASLTPQDQSQQPASSSPRLVPSSAGTTARPASNGALGVSPTVSSSAASSTFSPTVTTPSTSSSSNGFMGRLKHSVKKLARTPSAEQRFENGRPISSRKNFGAQTPNTTATSATLASTQGTVNSGNSPTVQAATLGGTAPGTTTNTSATSSPRATIMDGVGLATPGLGSVGASSTASGTLGLGLSKSGNGGAEDDQSTLDSTSSHSVDSMPSPSLQQQQLPPSTISVRPPHPPFTPPTSMDCPVTKIPAHIPVIISEQSREASSSVDLYRGSVGTLAEDYIPLVQIMPNWLLEVLLKNTIPQKEVAKISFVLRPHHDQEGTSTTSTTTSISGPMSPGDGTGRLGDLPGGNPRLTAPRMLRVRKVVGHVAEKLNLTPPKILLEAVAAAMMATPRRSLPPPSGPVVDHGDESHPMSRSLESVQEEEAEGTLEHPSQHPARQVNGSSTGSEQDRPPSSLSVPSRTSTPGPATTATATTPVHEGNVSSSSSSSSGGPVLQVAPPDLYTAEEEYRLRPENWLEILCNDQVLSPTMTLATIRTHHWKSGSDVVLTYRYKNLSAPVLNSTTNSSAAAGGGGGGASQHQQQQQPNGVAGSF